MLFNGVVTLGKEPTNFSENIKQILSAYCGPACHIGQTSTIDQRARNQVFFSLGCVCDFIKFHFVAIQRQCCLLRPLVICRFSGVFPLYTSQPGFWSVGCRRSRQQSLLTKPDVAPKKHVATCHLPPMIDVASLPSNPLFLPGASSSSLPSLEPWGYRAADLYLAVLPRKEACHFFCMVGNVRKHHTRGSPLKVVRQARSEFEGFLDGSRQVSSRGKCLETVVCVKSNVSVFKED